MDLKILKEKCILFNRFMMEKGGVPKELIPAYEESNKIIEDAYKRGQIEILKSMSVDIDDQIHRHMPASMAKEVKWMFKTKINLDIDGIKNHDILNRIVTKGKISNINEREIVLNRIDELSSQQTNKDEIKTLNKLLKLYDK